MDHAPLTVFVSVGDGNIISGIHKGFKDLYQLGWLPRIPRIIGVQAEGLGRDLERLPCEYGDDHARLCNNYCRLDLCGSAAGWRDGRPCREGNGRHVR